MKYIDTASLSVIAITLVLFGLALFLTGFTHDLLLETGVFLVSVKLIIENADASRKPGQPKNSAAGTSHD